MRACVYACVRVCVGKHVRACICLLKNTCLLPMKVDFCTLSPSKNTGGGIRAKFFHSKLLHIPHIHVPLYSGVYVYERPPRINCSVAECFPAKLR